MAYPELRLLGRWTHTGTQNANTYWSPAPVETTEPNLPQGYLTGKQVGEAKYMVVYSPVSAGGAIDDLQAVQLVLDGEPYSYIWLSARQDTNMAPAISRIRRNPLLSFGEPFLNRNGQVNAPTLATCPKFTDTITIQTLAGASNVTDDYTVEVWGYVYDSPLLAALAPVYGFGEQIIKDPGNSRQFVIPAKTVVAGGDWKTNWKKLPGGAQQNVDQGAIHKLIRQARNKNATTASETYKFQYQNSSNSPAVTYQHQNLYWSLTANQAILAERLGVRSPQPSSTGAELKAAWIETPSESQHRHPQGGIPAGYNLNEINFGLAQGETNKFDAVPLLPQGPQLLWNEVAYPTVVDNGTSVAADALMMAFVGTLVQTGSGNVI